MPPFLEPYRGLKTRHTCPSCGAAHQLVRYINEETNDYFADHVGRCNRQGKCRYHYPPRQFFADNPNLKFSRNLKSSGFKNRSQPPPFAEARAFDCISADVFRQSLERFEQNSFVAWLFSIFERADVEAVMNRYFIGTHTDNRTVFWQLDQYGRIRTGKIMRYDATTGKRRKNDFATDWIHSALKKSGDLPSDFVLSQCFFGEHLLNQAEEDTPVAIVESAKTAVIASLFFPAFVWVSSEGKTNELLKKLHSIWERQIILFPDADAFEKWTDYASEAAQQGLDVTVSDLVERFATDDEKQAGFDLADYLIQSAVSDMAAVNFAIDLVLKTPELRTEFDFIFDERLAIMKIDGNISAEEAFAFCSAPDILRFVAADLAFASRNSAL